MFSIDVLGTIDHGASKLSVSVSSVTSQSFLTYSQNELINKQLPEVLCGGNTVQGSFGSCNWIEYNSNPLTRNHWRAKKKKGGLEASMRYGAAKVSHLGPPRSR